MKKENKNRFAKNKKDILPRRMPSFSYAWFDFI